jgi:hypothetical protein
MRIRYGKIRIRIEKIRIRDVISLHASTVSVHYTHGPKYLELLNLAFHTNPDSEIHFHADPHPAFCSKADPYRATENYADADPQP